MARVYFISCEYLKEQTPVNNNVDNNLLNNAIWEAQSIHIQQQTGTKLYNKLVDLIRTGTISLPGNAAYKTLLDDYIQPTTAYWAWYESIPYLAMKCVNKGVERQNSDWSVKAELNEVEYLRDDIRNKCEFYSQRLTDFMWENRSKYPELVDNHKLDELHPTGNQYFSGVQFDGDGCACVRSMGYPCRTITLH